MADWYYLTSKGEVGPISSAQVKHLAKIGRIKPDTQIRKGKDGRWFTASKAKGLVFANEARNLAPAIEPPATTNVRTKIIISAAILAGCTLITIFGIVFVLIVKRPNIDGVKAIAAAAAEKQKQERESYTKKIKENEDKQIYEENIRLRKAVEQADERAKEAIERTKEVVKSSNEERLRLARVEEDDRRAQKERDRLEVERKAQQQKENAAKNIKKRPERPDIDPALRGKWLLIATFDAMKQVDKTFDFIPFATASGMSVKLGASDNDSELTVSKVEIIDGTKWGPGNLVYFTNGVIWQVTRTGRANIGVNVYDNQMTKKRSFLVGVD